MADLGEAELFDPQGALVTGLSRLAVADEQGGDHGAWTRWMAAPADGAGLPAAGTHLIETITYKMQVTVDFIDDELGSVLVGGRILSLLGSPTTVLMPSER